MNESDGLIREVDEAVRQERLQSFFSNFGRYILAITAVIIMLTIGIVTWKGATKDQHTENTLRLYTAIKLVENGNAYKARELFAELAESDQQSVALYAKMWLVKLKHNHHKKAEASTLAGEFRTNNAYEQPYDDWFSLYVPPAPQELDHSAFRLTNMERLALSHIRNGQMEDAVQIYRNIALSEHAPPTMRDRASLLLTTYLKPTLDAMETEPSATAPSNADTQDSVSTTADRENDSTSEK